MRLVYKYKLQPHKTKMKRGPIVHAEITEGLDVTVWVDCNSEERDIERAFRIFGTGTEIPTEPPSAYLYNHVKTVHQHDGYVWHLYENMKT